MIDEILYIKKKKKRPEDDTKILNKSAEEYADKTEYTGKVLIIAKSNSMKRSAKDKQYEKECKGQTQMKELKDTI